MIGELVNESNRIERFIDTDNFNICLAPKSKIGSL
jgi:hypothetical protein